MKANPEDRDDLVKQVVKIQNGVATVVSVEPHEDSPLPDAWLPKATAPQPGPAGTSSAEPRRVDAIKVLEIAPGSGPIDIDSVSLAVRRLIEAKPWTGSQAGSYVSHLFVSDHNWLLESVPLESVPQAVLDRVRDQIAKELEAKQAERKKIQQP
jgi:hypothetical protein